MESFLTPDAIATVGFPIVICIWLMRSGQQTISDNTKSTTALTEAITKLATALDSQGRRLEQISDAITRFDAKLTHLTELFVEHKTKLERNDHHEGH